MEAKNGSVLIAKSEKLICETLAHLLQINGYQAWICNSEIEITPLLLLHQPTIALIGHDVSQYSSLKLAIELKKQFPAIQFVLFTKSASLDDALEAFSAGISGYLLFQDGLQDLLDCVASVGQDVPFLSPLIRQVFMEHLAHDEESQHPISDREMEVMALVAGKYTNKEIADRLFISIYTVQDHRKNIRKKLKMKGGKNILIKYLQLTPPLPTTT